MSQPDPTTGLLAAARAYVAAYYSGLAAVHVKLELSDGRQVKLAVANSGTPPASHPKLSDGDQTVLEAAAELGGAPNAEQIAEQSGYPLDSHLKTRLSLLRARGYLGGAKGSKDGYPLTEKGAEALGESL